MANIDVEEDIRGNEPDDVLAYFKNTSVSANDTCEIYTRGFSNFLVFIEVDGECTITLDAYSPFGKDKDSEESLDTFISIAETVKTFTGEGSDILDLNEVITTKKALKANFLRFKFSKAVTASFAVVAKNFTGAGAGSGGVIENLKKWAGTTLTGRNISDDLAHLNVDLDTLLATADLQLDGDGALNAILKTDNIGLFKTADFTEVRDITRVGGESQTGRDWSGDFANLDIALSALRDSIGKIESVDSTTATLLADGTWTSAIEDEANTGRLIGSVYADVAGTLHVQQSNDSDFTNVDIDDEISVAAGDKKGFSVEKVIPYMRAEYVNGGSGQAAFRLFVERRMRLL